MAEFEQAIKQIQGKPDADAAWQIANLQLTERLSTEEFNSLESSFHGDLSRQALRGAADASDFSIPRPQSSRQSRRPICRTAPYHGPGGRLRQ